MSRRMTETTVTTSTAYRGIRRSFRTRFMGMMAGAVNSSLHWFRNTTASQISRPARISHCRPISRFMAQPKLWGSV